MSDSAEVITLLKQLSKMQEELESKEQTIKILSEEKRKLECGFQSKAAKKDGIYSVTRANGNVMYGFSMYDENGKKIKAERFKTRTEAIAAKRRLEAMKDERKLSFYQKNKKQCFQDFCNAYLEKAESEYAINTLEAAIGLINNHMNELVGIKITKLTKQVAQEWANKNRAKIKPSAYNNTLKLLKAIWNNAIRIEMTDIPYPFKYIKPINIKKECKTREPVRINLEQAENLIDTAKKMYNDYTYCIIATSIYAGLREGECMGLMWKDIDFENETISVNQQVQKVTKKRMKILLEKFPNLTEKDILITDRLKTEASKDTIVVPHKIIEILKDYKNKLISHKQLHELCFCKKDGSPLVARDFVRYRFKRVLKQVFRDEKYMDFHELRGSCATILYLAGVPVKIIQGILRHGKMSITEDVYIQIKKISQQVTETINKAFA